MRRPKYTKEQKRDNAEAVQRNLCRIKPHINDVRVNTDLHWTLFFRNGRRLELYPTTLGLQRQGKWLKWLCVDDIVSTIEAYAKLPTVETKRKARTADDDFDVVEGDA